jgi:pimeloyl-ACP methyl ester carboxylesterase
MKIDKCLFVIAVLYATSAAAQSPSITWEPYTLAMANDRKEPAELGRFKAPLRHGQAAPGTIDLAVVRLRSKSSTPAAPLIYLDGGPGGAGYTAAVIPEFADLFDRIRATRDVILLSQRGTGLSRPRPACPADGPLPADFLVSLESMTAALGERARRCAESLRARGLDIGAFNTEESAGDVAVLRNALGVPRVALFGFSYGTHLALAIMRRSPDAIDRVILTGTEGPGDTWKLPSTFDAQFDELARQAGGDLTATWLRLLARAAAQPLQVLVTMGDQTKTVAIGAAGLQYLLRRDVGDTNDWPVIPLLIAQADRGDFSLLGRLAGRRLAGLGSGMNLMPLAMDCASGAPAARLQRIRELEPSRYFGLMTNYPYPAACEMLSLPMLPDAFRAPVTSQAPTLFVSGTLDSNTPPAQADAVAARFSHAVHLVIENAGHESTLQPAAVRDAIVSFVEGKPLTSGRIAAPAVRFRLP